MTCGIALSCNLMQHGKISGQLHTCRYTFSKLPLASCLYPALSLQTVPYLALLSLQGIQRPGSGSRDANLWRWVGRGKASNLRDVDSLSSKSLPGFSFLGLPKRCISSNGRPNKQVESTQCPLESANRDIDRSYMRGRHVFVLFDLGTPLPKAFCKEHLLE